MTMSANETRPRNEAPVRVVGAARFTVQTARGSGDVPVFIGGAADMAKVERVVVMLHGRLRDADAYLHTAERALDASSAAAESTLLVVPQFLATADVEHHALDARMLHWEWTSWMGGLDARGPHALSSFDVLDALIEHYARLLAVREIVVAGHSGGAQVAHRYAIVGRAAHGEAKLSYAIANPSSYVYFDASRPYADATPCDDANDWKYGLDRLPRYASGDANHFETHYVQSEVTYLLGERDCDPQHPALDRSCAANVQGPHRLARGRAYYAYLLARHPRLRHRYGEVPGAGHSGEAMFVSDAGVRALFGADVRLVKALVADASGASE
jgi:pimeloyl-ACP methyl ester carboxylesterase